MGLKLWEKYAFFVAYVRADQFAKPEQSRPRLKRTRSCGEHAQLSMFGKNTCHGVRFELLLGKTYEPFLLDEVRRHAQPPVLFYARERFQPNRTVIPGSGAPGVAAYNQSAVMIAR
jgi:hypothetical protein